MVLMNHFSLLTNLLLTSVDILHFEQYLFYGKSVTLSGTAIDPYLILVKDIVIQGRRTHSEMKIDQSPGGENKLSPFVL